MNTPVNTLAALTTPPPATDYASLTRGGVVTVGLNQAQACVVLKIHDFGLDSLTMDEEDTLHRLVASLKDQLWP